MKNKKQLQHTQDQICETCHGRGSYDEDVAGDGGSRMTFDCESCYGTGKNISDEYVYKAVNMHDELVKSVKMLYQLAQQMSEAATRIKFKHDGIDQLLKQAELK